MEQALRAPKFVMEQENEYHAVKFNVEKLRMRYNCYTDTYWRYPFKVSVLIEKLKSVQPLLSSLSIATKELEGFSKTREACIAAGKAVAEFIALGLVDAKHVMNIAGHHSYVENLKLSDEVNRAVIEVFVQGWVDVKKFDA